MPALCERILEAHDEVSLPKPAELVVRQLHWKARHHRVASHSRPLLDIHNQRRRLLTVKTLSILTVLVKCVKRMTRKQRPRKAPTQMGDLPTWNVMTPLQHLPVDPRHKFIWSCNKKRARARQCTAEKVIDFYLHSFGRLRANPHHAVSYPSE